MAIIITGKTKCHLCSAVIEDGQEARSFGHFVSNEFEPLAIFNDAAFHFECFRNHPLANKAQKRYEELLQRLAPGNRFCVVCNKQIMDPDEYFTLGYLADNPGDPLNVYNYIQAHISCLPKWADLRKVYKLVKDLYSSAGWRGDTLKAVLLDLKRAIKD